MRSLRRLAGKEAVRESFCTAMPRMSLQPRHFLLGSSHLLVRRPLERECPVCWAHCSRSSGVSLVEVGKSTLERLHHGGSDICPENINLRASQVYGETICLDPKPFDHEHAKDFYKGAAQEANAFMSLKNTAERADGVIPLKMREPISVGMALSLQCAYCISVHT